MGSLSEARGTRHEAREMTRCQSQRGVSSRCKLIWLRCLRRPPVSREGINSRTHTPATRDVRRRIPPMPAMLSLHLRAAPQPRLARVISPFRHSKQLAASGSLLHRTVVAAVSADQGIRLAT